MPLPSKADLITEQEVSDITGIPMTTLRNQRYKGQGFPFYKIGRMVRYKRREVLGIIEESRVETALVDPNTRWDKTKGQTGATGATAATGRKDRR